eukprot:2698471-Pleurochrysis_carterae.AAC.1
MLQSEVTITRNRQGLALAARGARASPPESASRHGHGPATAPKAILDSAQEVIYTGTARPRGRGTAGAARI